ncbi:MAG: M24 family metallopeptidase [Beijerinckiaceae bacterium]
MKGAYIDRARASRLMAEAGLDALVLMQPENVQYATGAHPGVASLFRRAGAGIAVVPADPASSAAAVMPDLASGAVKAGSDVGDIRWTPIWVGTGTIRDDREGEPLARRISDNARGAERPSTFDQADAFGHLRDILAERGLAKARLGVELDAVAANDAAALGRALPDATLADASGVMRRLRMIKSPREIDLLRTGCRLAEQGVRMLLPEIKAGVSRDRLGEVFGAAVKAEARRLGLRNLSTVWEYISVGADPWGAPKDVAAGDVIKVDVGAVLSGYSSDSARTFVFGKASADQKALHAALLAGLETGLALMRPGVPLRDIHAAMTAAIRTSGLPEYRRGHFGHGLGQSCFSEEWPFIAADSDETLEPGMVMALEAPYYVDGLGGFIIEDQLLITASGAENMNALPHGLVELD